METIISTIEFSKDKYELIQFGTYKKMYFIKINGVAQKTFKNLDKETKDFFGL